MAVQEELARLGSVLKWEQDNAFSRDKVVVSSGEDLALGAVVGRITATDEVVELAPGASDGSQTAVGFLIADVDASVADAEGVIIARDAMVVASGLVWPTGITEPQKAAALETLEAAGVIVREEQ